MKSRILNWRFSRRRFLAGSSLVGALAHSFAGRLFALGGAGKAGAKSSGIYARLGVRTRINAKGTYTYLTGSLMPPEVSQAMEEAAQHYVHLVELQERVGERIARLLGVEAALVTSGAAGAITLGTAACVSGKDPEKILRLPDLQGMKSEVVIQKKHRNGYDHAIRNVGVRLVEVETEEELENAINEKTAMMYFLNAAQKQGTIDLERWVEVGKRRGVPTFNDAAADVPPPSHLSDYNKMGFDLVAFSGGKALRGPQCAGLLLGRKDLIEAAMLNNNPYSDTIGRPLKVGKEEVVGMLVALERYLELDHELEWKNWEKRLDGMARVISSVPGVETGRFVPEVANHVPHMFVKWDEAALGLTKTECHRQLLEGEPSIEVLCEEYPQGLSVTPYMMTPREDMIVARRIKEVLSTGQKRAAG
ncbi:MAG TPA: aminotransferase class V-fold PLP-dependent enzyme [Terriglobia bacterium]|jgi:L-seryl-tRNA(Ser) seleniumtransferase|nr:aminotransferase class V-fold PLP-dependent enzyme [Terriglobia bacterium]